MPQVTGYTAERMKAIEDASVVNGEINGEGHLILTRFDGSPIDAGPVTVASISSGIHRLGGIQLGADAISFDIQSIPDIYAHLRVVVSARSKINGVVDTLRIFLNNDLAFANYRAQYIQATGNTAPTSTERLGSAVNTFDLAAIPGNLSPANWFSDVVFDIIRYSETARHKSIRFTSMGWGADATTGFNLRTGGQLWRNNAKVNRITLATPASQLAAGSKVDLYGVMPGFM